ncbi:MAG: hypothetical protein H7328_09675 [Bdellovibrio sp.]|nr:hypothetical protein [Bdellovibrio sp.]
MVTNKLIRSEKIEEQIGAVLNRVRYLQKKIITFQAEAKTAANQIEVSARESLHKVFDEGLTLLGKGIVTGRKATESFVAETHRKAKKLKREAHAVEVAEDIVTEVIPDKVNSKKNNTISAKSVSVKNQMKTLKSKGRKNKANFATTARAH